LTGRYKLQLSEDLAAFGTGEFNIASPVPEPSTWAMMILGFAGVGFMAYRRKQNGRRFVSPDPIRHMQFERPPP